jgi:hypothetical protein
MPESLKKKKEKNRKNPFEVTKPEAEAFKVPSFLPCNSLAAASEGTRLLYAEQF